MNQTKKGELRWFIWTIVFLIVAGTLLVLYINYTSITFSNGNQLIITVHRAKHIVPPSNAPVQNLKTVK